MSGIMTISFTISEVPRARVNCARIGEVLSAPSVPERPDGDFAPFKGEISLPIYPQLDEEQLNFIINVVKAAYITVAGTE